MNSYYSTAKNQRIAPRKSRLVVDLVRGKNAVEMSEKLTFLNKKGAEIVKKVVDSAIANAVNNHGENAENLFISEARVDEAFTIKTW